MGEIKFRVFIEDDKNFINWSMNYDQDWFWKTVRTKKLTLEQYTGLKDKNGKEIYEGDVVKNFARYGTVVKLEQSGSYILKYSDSEYVFFPIDITCEVVGNIHENPDLLGAGYGTD